LTYCPLKEDACVRGYTLSLLLAIQLDICLAGLLPKGDTLPPGRCSRRPVATLLWCKPRQSKTPSSIHFVQSRNCIYLEFCKWSTAPCSSSIIFLGDLIIANIIIRWKNIMDSGHQGCCDMSQLLLGDWDDEAHNVVSIYFHHVHNTRWVLVGLWQDIRLCITHSVFCKFMLW